MRWASILLENASLDSAVREGVETLRRQLDGERPDLVVAFFAGHEPDAAEAIPELLDPLTARCLLGCSAGGVIGDGREVEQRVALSLTAAVMPGVRIDELAVDLPELPAPNLGANAWLTTLGMDSPPKEGVVVLADPFSFPIDQMLAGLDASFPGLPVIGGLASGAREPGGNVLILQDEVRRSGAVGISLRGNVRLDTLVAQGCRPIGSPMFVTRCQRNFIQELDGCSPYEIVRDLYQSLPRRDQELLQQSLFLGVVMRPSQQLYGQGDFLIRNVMGFDRDTGYVAVGAMMQEQQVVQFHLRDAETSRRDLEGHLRRYRELQPGPGPQGALLFSCLGRGERLYGAADHDSKLAKAHLGEVVIGGFFCNGEIGPVQGQTFLHGYTSSFGLFSPRG